MEYYNNNDNLVKLRAFGKKIYKLETDLKELKKKYRLEAYDETSVKDYMIFRRFYNWLFNIRVNNNLTGVPYIETVLILVNKEMGRSYLDDKKKEMLFILTDVLLKERKALKQKI